MGTERAESAKHSVLHLSKQRLETDRDTWDEEAARRRTITSAELACCIVPSLMSFPIARLLVEVSILRIRTHHARVEWHDPRGELQPDDPEALCYL